MFRIPHLGWYIRRNIVVSSPVVILASDMRDVAVNVRDGVVLVDVQDDPFADGSGVVWNRNQTPFYQEVNHIDRIVYLRH